MCCCTPHCPPQRPDLVTRVPACRVTARCGHEAGPWLAADQGCGRVRPTPAAPAKVWLGPWCATHGSLFCVCPSLSYVINNAIFRNGAGFSPAQHSLAVKYYRGQGVSRSVRTAAKWWNKAIRQGSAEAHLGVALVFKTLYGAEVGFKTRESEQDDVALFTNAAEQNK